MIKITPKIVMNLVMHVITYLTIRKVIFDDVFKKLDITFYKKKITGEFIDF